MAAYLQNFLHKFQHLEIQLEEIKSATDNFNNKNCIGVGGYGKVYKGEVSHHRGRSMVAIKRLDKSCGQGAPEFLKEITTLSRYNHENLISLVGFCYQGEEMILVYEHASRGSLDRYLNSPHLTWSQRIKICLGAAKGLSYLHDPGETYQRLIHCDIKSANILLDDEWNAKVSDLGLSIMGSANEQQSLIITLAAGTPGYCDPEYAMTHTLTKESDGYSFGVVLFEVLCGTLCYTCIDGHTLKPLVPMWIDSYKQNKLNDIIYKSLVVQPLDQCTLEIFSDIAYRCLSESREDRPMMTEVITELKTALEIQEVSERMQLSDYEEMARSAEPPLNYSSPYGLWKLLRKGVLLNDGKTWFSLNEKGEYCEMISIAECLDADTHESANSRFAVGPYFLLAGQKCKVQVKTQFLSPGITYTMDLMLRKTESLHLQWVSLLYKLEGEAETSKSYMAYESDDGYWWMCELYQFTSDQRDHDFLFELEAGTGIEVEGINFRPVAEVEHSSTLPDPDDANWEEKMPTNYADIIKQSNIVVNWTTKKESYLLLCHGFSINYDDAWFSLDKNGNKCYLLPARVVFDSKDMLSATFLPIGRGGTFSKTLKDLGGILRSSPESRFGLEFECGSRIPDIIRSGDDLEPLPSGTTLAVYLVYKLPKDFETNHPVPMVDRENNHWYIYLVSPETPVIRPKADQNTHSPVNRPKIKGVPRQRDDGWMEVQIWEYQNECRIHLKFPEAVTGLIIQGLELKFIENHFGTKQRQKSGMKTSWRKAQ